ncbi:FHA domain-containing protein [Deinococcus saxicola]|uniref:FHA domain-containing protein n=1 Tax=Deinococcus saxicola TaxID=249406 RepID=UPI003D0A14E2
MDGAPSDAPTPTGEARLGIKKFGAPTGEFIPLQGERLIVGRFDASSGPVDIDLSGLGGQEHISRRHAELYREEGRWAVRDLGSTNGVYIKRAGETGFSPRLQEPAPLVDGDELAFGNLMLIFHQS